MCDGLWCIGGMLPRRRSHSPWSSRPQSPISLAKSRGRSDVAVAPTSRRVRNRTGEWGWGQYIKNISPPGGGPICKKKIDDVQSQVSVKLILSWLDCSWRLHSVLKVDAQYICLIGACAWNLPHFQVAPRFTAGHRRHILLWPDRVPLLSHAFLHWKWPRQRKSHED